MGNKTSFPEPINTFFGLITAVIGVISTITGFILLWQGNQTVVTFVAIGTSVASIWIFLLYIRLGRKNPTQKQIKHNLAGSYLFSSRHRKWAGLGAILIPSVVIASFAIYRITNTPDDSNIIVVAKFDGPESYGVNNFIVDNLRESIKGYEDLKLKVVSVNEIITAQQGSEYAQTLGKSLNARTVIWGWFTASNESVYVTTHIEMIDVPYVYGSEEAVSNVEQSGILLAPSTEATSFKLQSELSQNISASALFATGLILYSENRHEDAVKLYSAALELFPPSATDGEFVFSRAEILSERGLALRWLERYDDAIKDANAAIALEPDNHTYYHNRGLIYIQFNKLDLALEDFTKAAQTLDKDNSAVSKLLIGNVYYLKEDYARALEYYNAAEIELPDVYMVYFQKGITYLTIGEKELARQNFVKAKELMNDRVWDSRIDYFIRRTY